MKMTIVLAVGAALLAGCSRSETFFDAHAQERSQTLLACKQGAVRGEDCKNAAASDAKARLDEAATTFRSMRGGSR